MRSLFSISLPRLDFNWIFALLQMAHIEVTERAERIVYVVAFAVVSLLFVFLLVVGVGASLHDALEDNFASTDSNIFFGLAFPIGYLALSCLKLLALMLLVGLSVAGLLIVRRSGGSAEQVRSLMRLLIVSLLLLAAEGLIFADVLLRSKSLGVRWFVPVGLNAFFLVCPTMSCV